MSTIGSLPTPPPKWTREIFPLQSISNNTIVLQYEPYPFSEFVIQNGDTLTDGQEYDYVISGKTITFNSEVLVPIGHIVVKYSYE